MKIIRYSDKGLNTLITFIYYINLNNDKANASLVPFGFGIDSSTGDYGYIKAGADSVTPFKSGASGDININSNGTFDVSAFANAIVSVTSTNYSHIKQVGITFPPLVGDLFNSCIYNIYNNTCYSAASNSTNKTITGNYFTIGPNQGYGRPTIKLNTNDGCYINNIYFQPGIRGQDISSYFYKTLSYSYYNVLIASDIPI